MLVHVFAINLEVNITTAFSRTLPSNSDEQPSNVGLHELATRSVVVSPELNRLVSVLVTKHFCLQAVNLYGALCCPDFPLPPKGRATNRPTIQGAKVMLF